MLDVEQIPMFSHLAHLARCPLSDQNWIVFTLPTIIEHAFATIYATNQTTSKSRASIKRRLDAALMHPTAYKHIAHF